MKVFFKSTIYTGAHDKNTLCREEQWEKECSLIVVGINIDFVSIILNICLLNALYFWGDLIVSFI